MMTTFSKSILIKADPESAFEAWTDLANIPDYMEGVQEVREEADDRSRWKMVAPDGAELEWVTQVTRNEPPNRFAWSTVEGDMNTSGQVTFHQVGDGQTEVTMMVNFGEEGQEPAAALGLPDPEEQVMQTLRDFKAMVEGR